MDLYFNQDKYNIIRRTPDKVTSKDFNSNLWVLEAARQLLPEHPAGDEVGGAVGGLGPVHDAERDLRAADGRLERGHRLRVRQAAEADVVHREQQVPLLRTKEGSLANGRRRKEERPFGLSPLKTLLRFVGSRDTARGGGQGDF